MYSFKIFTNVKSNHHQHLYAVTTYIGHHIIISEPFSRRDHQLTNLIEWDLFPGKSDSFNVNQVVL